MEEIKVYPGVRRAKGGGFKPQITLRQHGKLIGCKVSPKVFPDQAGALQAARDATRRASELVLTRNNSYVRLIEVAPKTEGLGTCST